MDHVANARQQTPDLVSPTSALSEDILRLSDLLSQQTVQSDELNQATHAVVTRIALTLQKETNPLPLLGERTTTILVSCIQNLLDGTKQHHHQIVSGHRHILRRLLVKICRDTGTLPPSLFLNGINCSSLHNVAGGSFSDIYRAEYVGEQVALKRLRVFQADPLHRASQFKAFCREALVWRQLRHPHILSFLGVDTKTFEPSGLHCMVSPWMDHGSLVDYMSKHDGGDDRSMLDRWVYEIADGLNYLHSEKVIHGDLRGANILVDANLTVKLSDFGLAKYSEAGTASWGTHAASALRWMAPEVLGGTSATFASDVYSFGCVCSELYTRRRPFFHITNDAHVVVQIMKGARPDMPAITGAFADVLRPLIHTCWNGAPSTRPSAETLSTALRPSIVIKQESDEAMVVDVDIYSGSAPRVSTPVSYLRISSAMDDNKPHTSTQSRTLQPINAQISSPVIRPLHAKPSSSSKQTPDMYFVRPVWQRAPCILIVDNTSSFQESSKILFKNFGCTVEQAHDGAEAMRMCDWNHTKYDLVFMRLNGASATYLIRDYDKRIPIIAIMPNGSKPEDILHNHYHFVGMNDILPSAPSSARLLGIVERYVGHLREKPALTVLQQESDLALACRKRHVVLDEPRDVHLKRYRI